MDIRNISTAVDLKEYGIQSLPVDCYVSYKTMESTINELRSALTPLQPALFIRHLDELYYQLVDHSTEQEIGMLESGYQGYVEGYTLHSQLFDMLASCSHQKIKTKEIAQALYDQIESWSKVHRDNELDYERYQESLRFKNKQ